MGTLPSDSSQGIKSLQCSGLRDPGFLLHGNGLLFSLPAQNTPGTAFFLTCHLIDCSQQPWRTDGHHESLTALHRSPSHRLKASSQRKPRQNKKLRTLSGSAILFCYRRPPLQILFLFVCFKPPDMPIKTEPESPNPCSSLGRAQCPVQSLFVSKSLF